MLEGYPLLDSQWRKCFSVKASGKSPQFDFMKSKISLTILYPVGCIEQVASAKHRTKRHYQKIEVIVPFLFLLLFLDRILPFSYTFSTFHNSLKILTFQDKKRNLSHRFIAVILVRLKSYFNQVWIRRNILKNSLLFCRKVNG